MKLGNFHFVLILYIIIFFKYIHKREYIQNVEINKELMRWLNMRMKGLYGY